MRVVETIAQIRQAYFAQNKPINLRIAEELGVREQQVAAAISLLDGGATVPFVARYRKEDRSAR